MKKDNTNTAGILVVDDDVDVLLAAEIVLKQAFGPVETEQDPRNLEKWLDRHDFAVILLDMNFVMGMTSGQEGFDWLRFIKDRAPDTNVILMTAYGGLNLAIKAIKQGATDFVVKPWDNSKLIATVHAATEHSKANREVSQLKTRQKLVNQYIGQSFGQIIGESEALTEVMASIDKVAATDANVLILGENGTGKELIARALHNKSLRAEQPFINIDIGAISETLFESELFGHTKGAFTDARTDRPGRFEVASGGTLFLDEIGNINMQMQAKLLGVLESRTLTRLGSDKNIPVDVRLICATNMPLHERVEDYRFRQDLLYRINTVELKIPPLRERLEDIPMLARHFISLFCRKYNKPVIDISSETIRKLKTYHWPGNIREFQNTVERALIMTDHEQLQPDDFVLSAPAKGQPNGGTLNLEEVEKETIQRAIIKHKNNLTRAAAELGLSRATLYRKISKYGI